MTRFTYVEMRCDLEDRPVESIPPLLEVVVEPIEKYFPEGLFGCYTAAFDAGDAEFYKLQGEEERRRYFDQELGFPDVLANPASFAYRVGEEIIGFALVHSYLEDNFHISCMCILPEYQGLGLGKAMLNRIKGKALENGCRSITLGTEPTMKAFFLYSRNGFEVTAEHIVDM